MVGKEPKKQIINISAGFNCIKVVFKVLIKSIFYGVILYYICFCRTKMNYERDYTQS